MSNSIISILEETGVVFRTKELNDQGLTNYEINKLLHEGVLEKLYQGVYTITDIEKITLSDINVIVENGIVSLTSAAFYYNLLDGESGKITLTLNRDQKPPKIPYEIFSYYYTTSKFYNKGLRIIDQNGRKLKIYDLERTVCDIVRHRNKYDSLIVREVIEKYLNSKECDLKKLIEYSKELRIYNILRQYLEILGGYNER